MLPSREFVFISNLKQKPKRIVNNLIIINGSGGENLFKRSSEA